MREKLTESEFIQMMRKYKSLGVMARELKMDLRSLQKRKVRVQDKLGIVFEVDTPQKRISESTFVSAARVNLGIENGTVIVFSDAHFWPGIHTTAYRGLLWAISELAPKAVIANGDIFDGASISRFPRIGFDNTPSVIQELKACEIAMGEIEEAAKKAYSNVKLVWPMGNHDARYEVRLAANAPQYEQIKGFSLKDHFPAWTPCWACWPTDTVVVKHRYKGGIHATHNNTVNSGVSMVTGHLHSLKVTPFSDYTGNRFGVDTGTLAEPNGPQFVNYLEDSPTNWRSGFAVLTFKDGQLLWPEIVHKFDENHVEFRGQVIAV
jgi:Calcineurin-like phosphoesterase